MTKKMMALFNQELEKRERKGFKKVNYMTKGKPQTKKAIKEHDCQFPLKKFETLTIQFKCDHCDYTNIIVSEDQKWKVIIDD